MWLVLFLININIIQLISKGHERKEITENICWRLHWKIWQSERRVNSPSLVNKFKTLNTAQNNFFLLILKFELWIEVFLLYFYYEVDSGNMYRNNDVSSEIFATEKFNYRCIYWTVGNTRVPRSRLWK